MRPIRLFGVLACLVLGAAVPAAFARGPSGLHVAGPRLLDGHGRVVHLHGVNRSGPEYACIQGWGVFDGPSGAASVAAIASWHANIVRIPLNEDCWLAVNGSSPPMPAPGT